MVKQNFNNKRTWIEIDTSAFLYNIELLRSKLRPGVRFAAVVKANAYGHGIVGISKLLSKKDTAFLAVTYIEEAIELRKNNISMPILMLSQPFVEDISMVIKNKITPAVYTMDFAERLSVEAVKKNIKMPIHIKVETGLNRLGFRLDTAEKNIQGISKLAGLHIEGIYSHFSNAFNKNDSTTQEQFEKFATLIKRLGKSKINPGYVHIANSAGYIWFPKTQCGLVRFGLAMYGLEPNTKIKYPLPIRQCFTWKTRILQIKEIKKGESVGYGNVWRALKGTKIATIAVGYADGFRRGPNNFMYVLCRGKKAKVLGDIAMSQSMIDVSSISDVTIDDEIVIIGKQEGRSISFESVASLIDTINEEVAVSIPPCIPRVYL